MSASLVGSEMCIRDRCCSAAPSLCGHFAVIEKPLVIKEVPRPTSTAQPFVGLVRWPGEACLTPQPRRKG
eukprot:14720938-Alexandrium_andersonii.AAC.1